MPPRKNKKNVASDVSPATEPALTIEQECAPATEPALIIEQELASALDIIPAVAIAPATEQEGLISISINDPLKANQFETIFQFLKIFSKEINIHLSNDAFYIQSLDNAKVCVFELTIPKTWFCEWTYNHDRKVILGISTILFHQIIKLRERGITLDYLPQISENKWMIKLKTADYQLEYELPLMEIDADILEIPNDNEYSVDMKISSFLFSDIINKLHLFGDTLIIECDENSIFFYATSPDKGQIKIEINIDDITELALEEGALINISFGMQYIHTISLFHKVSKNIEIHLKNDEPVKIIYDFGEDENIGKMTFFLAPKINDNE